MRKRFIPLCLLMAGLSASFSQAQNRKDAFFKAGDKVNFIGNSITHYGEFHNHVMLYYATRFPNAKVEFLNSGISGDNANDILKRLDTEIIPKNATYSIIMAGMNDVNRALYAPSRQGEAGIEEKKKRAISDYRDYMTHVLEKLSKTNTKIILQKPSIYDQTSKIVTENHLGVNDALGECSKILEELAKKYNAKVVDYYTFMNQTNAKLQKLDPAGTIVSIDRIHPWATGDLIMAYQFLKETNAPQYVADVQIEGSKVNKCDNCTATEVKADKAGLQFKLKEESLPFPLADEPQTQLALNLIPFQENLNREMLKVAKLPESRYSLSIDNTFIGTFSNEDLSKGVNLALYRNTPQYQQALKMKDLAKEHRAIQRQLRDIKLVQYRHLPAELWAADLPKIETYINKRLDLLKTNNGQEYAEAKQYFGNYLALKPKERSMEARIAEINTQLYQINKPTTHTVKLEALAKMPYQNVMLFGLNQAGADFGQNFPGEYGKDYFYPTTAQLDYMKKKNFSLLRLPFKWERIQRMLNGELDPMELSRMKAVVDAARARNQWVLLDLHNYCRRYMHGEHTVIGSPGLPVSSLADMWTKLAKEFKGYDNIYGYGLMNEPHDLLSTTPWYGMAQACIDQIRTVDKKTPIVVGGAHWSSAAKWQDSSANLKNLKDPSKNLRFEAHLYFDTDGSGTYKYTYEKEGATPNTGIDKAKPFVEWLRANKLQGFIGEYGIPDKDERWQVTLDNLLSYLKTNCVGGIYWAAGPGWGEEFMAVEPINGKDRPQMKVLDKYKVSNTNCK